MLLDLLRSSFLLSGFVHAVPTQRPRYGQSLVELNYGTYQGTSLSAGVTQYLGMRFAEAPLGDLRWRAPVDPVPFKGVQNTTAFQPICRGLGHAVLANESEDCLYVNVFTPSNATSKSMLPVWLYIQGGGYTQNANANYNGTNVVVHSGLDIILVNFNYRVGMFGFLASEEVREDGDLNAGLLDQRKAMQWVRKYISEFGGDPNHVVIHGASAGAGSVGHHLVAYAGENMHLFVGAVAQSPFFPAEMQVSQLEWQYQRFVGDAGCNGTANSLACLRSQNDTILQLANVGSPFPGQTLAPLFYTTPCIDSVFLTDYPYRLFEEGRFVDVPLIVGDETNEGSVFASNATSPADVASFFTANYPELLPNDTAAINAEYPLMAPLPEHAAYFPSASAAYGEATFVCAGNLMCETRSGVEVSRVWNYRYDVTSVENIEAGDGVPHTFDSAAIFGADLSGPPNTPSAESYLTYNAPVVPVLMDYYISFVKSLNPNTYRDPGTPEWLNFGQGRVQQRLLLDVNQTLMEAVPASQQARCTFWDELAVTMQQ